jgi:hypothetical protein
MVVSGIILALTGAISGPGLLIKTHAGAAALFQASTPTPIPAAISRAGSTDGIMLMGVVIVMIVLLPILLRRSTWTNMTHPESHNSSEK